ncbi:hypothetical protein BDW22DRAFT_1357031 [Trametopsis cervina]|nr:hypothetical protein BDW22DRAFT_1357031 [Trametopsis cervina]
MATQQTFGRNRQSIEDIERELYDLFRAHPKSTLNQSDEPVIPGAALVDILRSFSTGHNSVELISKDEEEQLVHVLDTNPGIEVTPQMLLQFIAQRTEVSPDNSSDESPSSGGHEVVLARGRPGEKTEYVSYSRSRSSSQDAIGASVYTGRPTSRPPSRPPSRGSSSGPPKTPFARESPFDTSARQRTTPLVNAPSSWARRPPPSRRKSDAGSHSRAVSDSESSLSSPPVAYSRSHGQTGRARAPSNPTTPEPYSRPTGTLSPISIGSPTFSTPSRPHSRAQSQPQSHFPSIGFVADEFRYVSPDRNDYNYDGTYNRETGMMSPPPSDLSETSFDAAMRANLARRSEDSDSDGDDSEGDHTLDFRHSRESSTTSLNLQERLDAMHKVHDDLRRKLKEAEDNLQHRMADHEDELARMEQELETLKDELISTKKQEKELRSKERSNSTQISAQENQIISLNKTIEASRINYANLNAQYQEQCAESQRQRSLLTDRDKDMHALRATNELQALDIKKWADEHVQWQLQTKHLEEELAAAQRVQAELEEQKHENLMLKETIDRMKYEMEEMRQASSTGQAGSGLASSRNSISRSLGAELASQMSGADWDAEEETDEAEEQETSVLEDEDTESEDIVQTIITRTKRKVPSRAKRIDTQTFEETRVFSDAAIQHDVSTGTFAAQTDPEPRPILSSSSIQAEPHTTSMETQTDPEPIDPSSTTSEIQIQTEDDDADLHSSFSSLTDSTASSSSSTALPATPKSDQLHTHTHDQPPTYSQVTGHSHEDELAIRVADETLRKWHKGLKFPIEPVPGGVSEDAIADWRGLKEELGVECSAIDRLVEESARTGLPRARRGRFYNIYNTYVYGGKGYALLSTSQIMLVVGATAATAFLLGQAMTPHYYGPTYYDREAWSSFNSIQVVGEGFPGDGSTAFWNILGRIGGGAARTLRGFPT